MLLFVILTIVGIGLTLYSQWKKHPILHGLGKTIASLAFLAAAIHQGALDSDYGLILLAALILCAVGDLALIGRSKAFFLSGLVAFLLGHVGYVGLFIYVGLSLVHPSLMAGSLALLVVAAISYFVYTKLSPHIPKEMVWPTRAYILVISVMVVAAWAVGSHPGFILLPVGATLFYFSDLFVARDRYVSSTILNRCFGLPIYYAAQLFFAGSIP
jgi:uncharacterized membrane protein YhhN